MVNLCPDALLDDGLLDFTLLFGSLGKQVSWPVRPPCGMEGPSGFRAAASAVVDAVPWVMQSPCDASFGGSPSSVRLAAAA